MRKRKERDRGKQTLDVGVYPMVRLATKAPLAACVYPCECFNKVDVGVPLWLTEPWDKHPRREFASSYPVL